jgi:hypothetical protein
VHKKISKIFPDNDEIINSKIDQLIASIKLILDESIIQTIRKDFQRLESYHYTLLIKYIPRAIEMLRVQHELALKGQSTNLNGDRGRKYRMKELTAITESIANKLQRNVEEPISSIQDIKKIHPLIQRGALLCRQLNSEVTDNQELLLHVSQKSLPTLSKLNKDVQSILHGKILGK